MALVLNPAVVFLQRHRFRRGAAIGVVFLVAVVLFGGLLGLFGYPLVNSLTHFAERAARPWSTRSRRGTAGWPTPSSGSTC